MKKFIILLNKELREMITPTVIISMLVSVFVFYLVGNFMGDTLTHNDIETDSQGSVYVTVADNDNSSVSQSAIEYLNSNGFNVKLMDNPGENPEPENGVPFIYIPSGFGASINAGEYATVKLVREMKSVSIMTNISDSLPYAAVDLIDSYISHMIIGDKDISNPDFARNPIQTSDVTWISGKSADISPEALLGMMILQTLIVPIAVFLIVVLGSQTIASAIANEKGDKTLETLLSAPVSRLSILMAKMTAAALVALGMAAIMGVGGAFVMPSLTGSVPAADIGEAVQGAGLTASAAMKLLGLTYTPAGIAVIAANLLATVVIALAVSMILGSLAQDAKSAQTVVTPIMLLVMVPYFLTIFTDINSMPLPSMLLVYAIPFTSTFAATSNVLLQNYMPPILGLIYQIIFLAVIVTIAVKIFSSDKIFTLQINFGKKKKNNM